MTQHNKLTKRNTAQHADSVSLKELPLALSATSVYLKLVIVSVIWGGTFIAGRLLIDIPPLLVASLRFVIASFVLFIFLICSSKSLARVNLRQGVQLALLGFFGVFVYNICFFYGLHYINASRASLIVALNPVMIALASYGLLKEHLSWFKLCGVILCLLGAVIVIASKDNSVLHGAPYTWKGDLFILCCVGSWTIYSVFSRNLSQAIGPFYTVTYSIMLGTLMLCATTLFLEGIPFATLWHINISQLASLLYLGALGSALAYIWYYDGIRKIGAARSGVFIALNPMTAVLLGALLLGEHLSISMGIGGVLIILGIVLNNWPRQHKQ